MEPIRQLMIMAKDKLYSCCPPETVSFYCLTSENAVWPNIFLLQIFSSNWQRKTYKGQNIDKSITLLPWSCKTLFIYFSINDTSGSQPDKVSSFDLIMDPIKYLLYYLSCLYQIYLFLGFPSIIEQELDSLQTPKDIITSLQISSEMCDKKNKPNCTSFYRRWSYPLCDYKPNQIFWSSEPSPIMDDITFCRYMLNLVWFLRQTKDNYMDCDDACKTRNDCKQAN